MDHSPAPPAPAATRHRFSPWLKGAAAVVGVLVAAYVVQYVTKGSFWRSTFERVVSDRAGRDVQVAGDFQLYLAPDIRFRAEGLTVANPKWAEADMFLAARRISVDASIWQAITGDLTIGDVRVDGAVLNLQRRADRANTWTFGDEPLELPDIIRAAATDSRIVLNDAPTATRMNITLGTIAGTANSAGQRIDGPLVFAGTGTTRGAAIRINGRLTTPNQAAAGGRLGLELSGNVVRTDFSVTGMLPGATRFDGADLRVAVKGRNLADPGQLFGIALPATRPYDLAANLAIRNRDYRLTRLNGRIGNTDMAGRITVTLPAGNRGRARLAGALTSNMLDIKDVGPLVGYDPARIDAGQGVVKTVAGRPRLLPDAPLAVEALGAFDAAIDYRARLVRTGQLPFTNLRLRVGLDNQLLTLAPLAFDIATGRLIARIAINARQAPVRTEYDVRLTQIPLGKLFSGFNVEDAGTTASLRGRLKLSGVGDTVHDSLASSTGRIALVVPTGTLWLRNIELAELDLQNFLTALIGKKLKEKRDINCGIVAFTVTGGKAVADPILIDTDKAVFRGRGGFDFGDESLAMSLEGDSKQFSLFSGQSPIGIRGYFADPSVNPVSGELLARGGAGLLLGVAATPLAALAAFVDLGDAKDVNCTPILAAKRDTARGRAENARAKN